MLSASDVEVVKLDIQSSSSSSSYRQLHPGSSSSSSSSIQDGIEVLYERSPLQEILVLFPDANESFVRSLLVKYGSSRQSIIEVVQIMAEKGYDKKDKKRQEEEMDYSSTSWKTSSTYRDNSLIQLQNDFPYIKVEALKTVFTSYKHHYMPTLRSLEEAIGRKANNYKLARKIQGIAIVPKISDDAISKIQVELVRKFNVLRNKCTRKTFHKFVLPIDVRDPIFVKEMDFMNMANAKEQTAKEEHEASLLANKIAEETNTAIECECCCSEYAFENLGKTSRSTSGQTVSTRFNKTRQISFDAL